jgi:hypothetical protein
MHCKRALWCVSGVDACPNSEMVRLSPGASATIRSHFQARPTFFQLHQNSMKSFWLAARQQGRSMLNSRRKCIKSYCLLLVVPCLMIDELKAMGNEGQVSPVSQ